jgi:hypothetical protein
MMNGDAFGFDHYNRERRRFSGRRMRDRRDLPDRRVADRRVQVIAVAVERRSGEDRRVVVERRRGFERRRVDDRRSASWHGFLSPP